jgi:fructose/tagatose bisphosphate aldolase
MCVGDACVDFFNTVNTQYITCWFCGKFICLGSLETGMMGEEDGHGAEGKLDLDMLLTSVEEAADFVKATNVDALAIAIGTFLWH